MTLRVPLVVPCCGRDEQAMVAQVDRLAAHWPHEIVVAPCADDPPTRLRAWAYTPAVRWRAGGRTLALSMLEALHYAARRWGDGWVVRMDVDCGLADLEWLEGAREACAAGGAWGISRRSAPRGAWLGLCQAWSMLAIGSVVAELRRAQMVPPAEDLATFLAARRAGVPMCLVEGATGHPHPPGRWHHFGQRMRRSDIANAIRSMPGILTRRGD